VVWSLAERFGWSLEYVEALPLTRLMELHEIDEARGKAREQLRGSNGRKSR